MSGYFSQAGVYLIQVMFGLYILAVMLRFIFQWVRADFYNPLSQALVKITNPPVVLLRRIIPGLWGIDLASVFLMLVLKAIEISLIVLMSKNLVAKPLGLLIASGAELLSLLVMVFFVAVLVRIILSWVAPNAAYNPMGSLLNSLTEPVMAPARRIIPPLSGLDLSPIAVMVVLQLILMLVVQPLLHLGYKLM